jgi:hypothetical protein
MGEIFIVKTFEKHSCMDENDSNSYLHFNFKNRCPDKFRGNYLSNLEISVHMHP